MAAASSRRQDERARGRGGAGIGDARHGAQGKPENGQQAQK
jgi:hypothetical protein